MLGWVLAAVRSRTARGNSPELLESRREGPRLLAAIMLVLCQLQRPQFPSSVLTAATKDSSLGYRRFG